MARIDQIDWPTVAAKVALPDLTGNSPAASSISSRCIRHGRRFGEIPMRILTALHQNVKQRAQCDGNRKMAQLVIT